MNILFFGIFLLISPLRISASVDLERAYDECHSGKRECYGKLFTDKANNPSSCIKNKNCNYFVTIEPESEKSFKIQLFSTKIEKNENGWIGFGFSEDKEMGQDILSICAFRPMQKWTFRSDDSVIPTYTDYGSLDGNRRPKVILNCASGDASNCPEKIIKYDEVEYSERNRERICSFVLQKSIYYKGKEINYDAKDKFYVFLAVGGIKEDTGEWAYHRYPDWRFVSQNKFRGCAPKCNQPDIPILVVSNSTIISTTTVSSVKSESVNQIGNFCVIFLVASFILEMTHFL